MNSNSSSAEAGAMRALVLHAVGDARLEQVPRPVPKPGEALVRVAFCGVCGSDIPRTFVHGTYHFPTICGHEFAGTIEECGADMRSFAPGDRVAVFPLLWCGRCPACEEGKFVQCSDYDYLGSRRDGAFAQFVAVPERNLLRVPEGVSLEEAAMTEPAAVALHALRRVGESLLGQTVAIFGAGPIGLMVAQWARVMGAFQVVLFDLVPEKLALARKMGFPHAYDVRETTPDSAIGSLTEGQGADVCIEAAGVAPTTLQALALARRGGRVVLLGNPSGDVTLSASLISQLMRREVSILGTWNSDYNAAGNRDDWRAVLEAMAAKAIDLRPLITHKILLDEAFAALRMMRDQSEFFSKVLVQPDPSSGEASTTNQHQ